MIVDKYILVSKDSAQELNQAIRLLVKDCWEPYGSPCVSICNDMAIYAQAVVKREETDEYDGDRSDWYSKGEK